MRIAIIGTGGIGGYFGAKLARAGEEVTFVARGAHLAAIQAQGLRIRSPVDGEFTVRARAQEDLAGHEPVDVVLICVKSYDTEGAAELARPVVGANTAVLSLQNGIDNEDKIARLLGNEHVQGGAAYIFSAIEAPGVIAHRQHARIAFGELNGEISARARSFAEACVRAGIQAEAVPNIRKTLWEKYVGLVALAGTTALTRLPVGVIRAAPATRRLWQTQVEELLAIAGAERVGLDADFVGRLNTFVDSLAPANISSLAQDLLRGRRLELDALHGHAVRLGERHKIPVPTLFAVYGGLLPYIDGPPVPRN